jgi:hypothetical protein
MNLGHVDDATQIMAPGGSRLTPRTYGDGDRNGLYLLGSGRR